LDVKTSTVFRYGFGSATSKALRTAAGVAMRSLQGMAISGDQLWVVDPGTAKILRYSLSAAFTGTGTINALQEISLIRANRTAEGLAIDGTYLYVLGGSQFYRYPRAGGTGVASRVMKDSVGSNLGSPVGSVLVGNSMWIVDKTKGKSFLYSLSDLQFGTTGNVNALRSFTLNGENRVPAGISYSFGVPIPAMPLGGGIARFAPTEDYLPILSDPAAIKTLSVYPNPANDRVTLQFMGTLNKSFKITVSDTRGMIMQTDQGYSHEGVNTRELNISRLAQGTYLITLDREGVARKTQKLVVY
jgi:hypothetical protein